MSFHGDSSWNAIRSALPPSLSVIKDVIINGEENWDTFLLESWCVSQQFTNHTKNKNQFIFTSLEKTFFSAGL